MRASIRGSVRGEIDQIEGRLDEPIVVDYGEEYPMDEV